MMAEIRELLIDKEEKKPWGLIIGFCETFYTILMKRNHRNLKKIYNQPESHP